MTNTTSGMELAMNKIMSNLKPCPFCGGKGRLLKERFDRQRIVQVYCSKCDCGTREYGNVYSPTHAVNVWNKRPYND